MVSGFEFSDLSKEEVGNYFNFKYVISLFPVLSLVLALCFAVAVIILMLLKLSALKGCFLTKQNNRKIVDILLKEDFLSWTGSYHNLYQISAYLNEKKKRTQ